jgi:hypothetical protein
MAKFYLFLDESGDHGLRTIDEHFPIFVLTGILISEQSYAKVCGEINALKQKFFGTEAIILHRRDMRKYEHGFEIFFDNEVKKRFYQELNAILQAADYKIISSVVDKQKHINLYGKLADDPYEIALTFVLERTIFEADHEHDAAQIHVTIEGRGRKEDSVLAARYNELLYRGTPQVEARRFVAIYQENLDVRVKKDNDCGLQLADLCAYPIARFFLDSNAPNPAYDVIKDKIRRGPKGIIGYGVKVFP